MSGGALFSIGHSTLPLDRFVALLRQHDIQVLADVRSMPFSRFNPQYNRESLAQSLKDQGIRYAYFGAQLGARSDDPADYANGRVSYSRLARRPEFRTAIGRLVNGAADHRIALMCAEKEPLNCHRTIHVSQELFRQSHEVLHIHHDGRLEPHSAALERLLDLTGVSKTDLFKSRDELFAEALEKQGARMSYRAVTSAGLEDLG